MTQHTPGPWTWDVGEADGPLPIYEIYGGSARGVIAQLAAFDDWSHPVDDATNQANARLIAAAPEMVAALKWALDYLGGWPADPQQRECRETIRALLAKIEGGK